MRGFRLVLLLGIASLFTLLFYGCGRSALDGYDPLEVDQLDANVADHSVDVSNDRTSPPIRDAGRDAAETSTCGAANCPNGCCDAQGVCRQGTQLQSCGTRGVKCEDCRNGFDLCHPTTRQCARTVNNCNAQTCGGGCCISATACVPGNTSSGCGTGGKTCQTCKDIEVCDATSHSCRPTTCNATNCPQGCCDGTVCRSGVTQGQCGLKGQACKACGTNEACTPVTAAGGQCQPTKTCTPTSCPNGCCTADDRCVDGSANNACGTGGACTDCTKQSEICIIIAGSHALSHACAPPPPECNPGNCSGCCDGTDCHAGFLPTRCGSGGTTCANCVASGASCNVNTRVCSNEPSNCPAAYGTCSGSLRMPALPRQQVCTFNQLADGRAACDKGPNEPGCNDYFAFLQGQTPACAACLTPFKVPFTDTDGIAACVAPFVSDGCNHLLACSKECTDTACNQCADSVEGQCRQNVRLPGGECSSEFTSSTSCAVPALLPGQPGDFCSPVTSGGNYGRWLEEVGRHYCGP